MRIRLKTLIICSSVAILAISMVYFISENTLLQRTNASESEYVRAEINRVYLGLSSEFFRLETAVADWANWDDTYQFIEDNNTNYKQTNLVPQALQDLKLNLMLFVNLNGTIVTEKVYNLTTMTEMPFDSSQILSKYSTLLQPEAENKPAQGFIQLQEGPMLVTSAPILTSDYQGPARGKVIFGRFLDDEEIAFLSNIVGLPIVLHDIDDPNMSPDVLEGNNSQSRGSTPVVKPVNETFTAGYSFIKDFNEKPIALMQVLVSRIEYAQAQISIFYLGISIGLIGLILIVLILLLLDRFVLSRLAKLSDNVKRLSLNGGQLVQFEFQGTDEISDLAGKINEMVSVIDEAQTSLKDYAANLEKRVDDKTKEVVETQKMLVQAERFAVIGQMAAMVAHDLRNPLFGIKNAMFYLRRRADIQKNEQELKMLGLIDEGINNANKIVNDLLDFSREIKLEKETVRLEKLVSDSLLANRPPDRIRVVNIIDPSMEVNVDTAKFNRIFINLISNAFDAMPNGGVLEIKSIVNGEIVNVSFADTGIGIAPENLDKLLKPLFTTKAKGMGLGLVICKRFAEAHGGGIKVTSEEGKGAVFIVSIPIARGKQST